MKRKNENKVKENIKLNAQWHYKLTNQKPELLWASLVRKLIWKVAKYLGCFKWQPGGYCISNMAWNFENPKPLKIQQASDIINRDE